MMKISEIILWAQKAGFQFDFEGNPEDEISGFSSLSHYKKDTITWIKKKAPDDNELINRIKCVVIQKGINITIQNKFISSNSKELFFAILGHYFSTSMKAETIGKGTVIGENASLGKDIRIGSNCVLDGLIQIGDRTVIEHNVSIMNHVVIGEDCIIHSGTIIGKDGFGFAYNDKLVPKKVPHFGGVLIGDRVEIGANCTIDRGTIDDTIIGNDVKIDNLVQIAHNVEIGEGTLVLGCTDIAGSAKIGQKSYIGPQVCIKNQASVGNNSFVGMDVMVNEHVGDNMMIVKSNANKVSKNQNYRRFL